MKPVVSIVGRPNVGKSTLFNRLTGSRSALTADTPGLTRDILTADLCSGDKSYLLMDTAGICNEKADAPTAAAIEKSMRAIDDAQKIIWVIDARAGLNSDDLAIAEKLRRQRETVSIAINKSEDTDTDELSAECYRLGYRSLCPVSALHNRGMEDLMRLVLSGMDDYTEDEHDNDAPVRVTIAGRQNAGKSTLVNCLLGEDRMLAGPTPGITRDSVAVDLHRGRHWQLIDTAGMRRRSKVTEKVETLSMVKSLQSIAASDITLLLMDASAGVTRQDMQLLDIVLQQGKRYIAVMNKSDLLPANRRKLVRSDFAQKLSYVPGIKIYAISALQRTHIRPLLQALDRVAKSCNESIPTPKLNRILQQAVNSHPPPLHNGRRPRLLYAHLDSLRPLRIVIHGRQVESLRASWKRYLARFYTDALKLEGTPVQLVLRTQENPYHG